jgi:hypothetical protein
MPVDHEAVAGEFDVGDAQTIVADRRPRDDPLEVKARAPRRTVKPPSVLRADALEKTLLALRSLFTAGQVGGGNAKRRSATDRRFLSNA